MFIVPYYDTYLGSWYKCPTHILYIDILQIPEIIPELVIKIFTSIKLFSSKDLKWETDL